MRTVLVLFAMCLCLAACNETVEQTVYETIVGAKAFTDSVKTQHPECATGSTSTICTDLAKAIAAKDALIDAAEVACAGPDFNSGGKCDFPSSGTAAYTEAVAKINAAIGSYNQIAADLKGAL